MRTIGLLACLLCAFAAPAAAGEAGDPGLSRSLAALARQGYQPERIITDTVKGVRYSAVLLRGASRSRLNVYARVKGRTSLVYIHPGPMDRLEFSSSMVSDRQFLDFMRDGSKAVVYRAVTPAFGKSTLFVLRCRGGRVRQAATFPEGGLRDLDDDGNVEVVSRSLPLGRFFSTGCEDFQTMSQTAFQTRVHAWKGGAFMDASADFPAFFDEDIARLEERLALVPKEKRPGDYLGAALSLYYDYEAKGERRRGWERLGSLLEPPVSLPALSDCIGKAKADLRRRLAIPADWP